MTRRGRLVVLALAGAASVLVAEWASLDAYARIDPTNVAGQAIHDALPPVVYIVAGIVAVAARPDSRLGEWLWLAGVLTFTGNVGNTLVPGLSQLGIGLTDIYQIPIGLAILTYPSGLVRSRPVRWLALVAVAQVVIMGLLTTAFLDPARCAPGWCPANPFLLITDQQLVDGIRLVQQVTGMALWITFATFVVHRYLRATPASRRFLTPVWVAGVIIAGSSVVSVSIAILAGGVAGYAYDFWVGFALSMAPPVIFLVGLLRQRLDRAAIAEFVEEIASGVSIGGLRDAFARLVDDSRLVPRLPAGRGRVRGRGRAAVELPSDGDRSPPNPARRADDRGRRARRGPADRSGAGAGRGGCCRARARERAAHRRGAGAARGGPLVAGAPGRGGRRGAGPDRTHAPRRGPAAARCACHPDAEARGGPTDATVRDRLDALGTELDDALAELRELARGIHPGGARPGWTRSALAGLAQRSPIPGCSGCAGMRFPSAIESTAYYVAAEALTNAARHARAPPRWRYRRGRMADTFRMTSVTTASAGRPRGWARAWRGSRTGWRPRRGHSVVQAGPEGGTLVEVRLPIGPSEVRQGANEALREGRLAEDSDLLRESLGAALTQRGVEVVGMVSGEAELLAAVERFGPDAAIIDIRMPPTLTTEGLRAAAEIRARQPRFPVLLLSHHVEAAIALQLVRDEPAGIGYLLKDRVSNVAQLVAALERIIRGGSVIDPEVVAALIGRPRHPGPLDELTSRERDVLRLMAEGRSNRGIAQDLGLEEKTVEHHVGQVFSKLGLEPGSHSHRRVLAVLAWLNQS